MVVTKSNASTSVVFLAAVFCCNEVSDRGFLGCCCQRGGFKVEGFEFEVSVFELCTTCSALELLNWHP